MRSAAPVAARRHADAVDDPTWVVLAPMRVAMLDGQFARRLGQYPELAGRLFERAIRRSRRLMVNMAIIHQARVDDRLHLLFWHFASRWGRVRGDGVLLPFRLTHAVLADLVAAQRPTVTSALSDLCRRGMVRAIDEGWLLAGDPPARSRACSRRSSRRLGTLGALNGRGLACALGARCGERSCPCRPPSAQARDDDRRVRRRRAAAGRLGSNQHLADAVEVARDADRRRTPSR